MTKRVDCRQVERATIPVSAQRGTHDAGYTSMDTEG